MSNETKKLYAERDAMELDQIGGHYFKHVMAMTSESLHSKSDIAAELGWRDCQIEQLEQQLAESQREFRSADATIENLQMQVEKLAAENAGLSAELSAIDAIHNDAVFITDDHYEQCPPEVQKIIRSLAVLQVPAYKDFLVEVRASGVEMYAEHLTRKAIASGENKNHAYAYLAANFADQLRQGGAA